MQATHGPGSPPPLLEQWMEQVVLVDWPIFTPKAIAAIADMALKATPPIGRIGRSPSEREEVDSRPEEESSLEPETVFSPTEVEGRLFFEGQAVALLPLDPCYVHPLMDEAIFSLLRSVPHMQVVIVLPEVYAHVLPSSSPDSPSLSEHSTPRKRLSVEWAKKLARRLWVSGGNLHQRIRFLPSPMSDSRLLQLMRQADVVLDSFPMGASLHPLGLALSVGTPVVTMRSGVLLRASPSQSSELRKSLQHIHGRHSSNLAFQILSKMGSPPWSPCISPLGEFYNRVGLGNELVADSIAEYIAIAETVATDREKAYDLRVRISDAIDGEHHDNYVDDSEEEEAEGFAATAAVNGKGVKANASEKIATTNTLPSDPRGAVIDESMRDLEE